MQTLTSRKDKKVLLENSIASVLTQAVSFVLPLISLPYLSRVLGVEKFGLVFWAQAAIQYFIIFTTFGFNMSSVREIAICKGDIKRISEIFNSVLFAKFILVLISLVILSIAVFSIPKFRADALLFYLTFFMVIGNAIYPLWFFQGIEHMKYITFLNIVTKTIFLLLIFIFVKHESDYIVVALLNSLGFIISGGLGIYFAVKRFGVKLYIPEMRIVINQLKTSFPFFIGRFSESMFQTTSSFCLGLLTNPTIVGYYIAAEKIYQGASSLQSPLTSALYPYMAKTRDIKFYKKVLFWAIFVLFFICTGLFIVAPFLIKIFYGAEMMPAYKVLRIFSITLFFGIICGITRYPFVGALGHVKVVNFSATVAAIVQILIYIVVYKLGMLNIISIAYLTILPEIIILSFSIATIVKYNLFSEDNKLFN